MAPRTTRRLTPLTATNPANSLVRSSVSRIMSSLIHDEPHAQRPIVGALGGMSRPKFAGQMKSLQWADWVMLSWAALGSLLRHPEVRATRANLRKLRHSQSQ